MDLPSVPEALQERLGPEATADLLHVIDAAGREWKTDVMNAAVDRFERRLVEETSKIGMELAATEGRLREQIANSVSGVRQDVSGLEGRLERRITDLLKWSFVFWIGQVVALTAIMSAMLR